MFTYLKTGQLESLKDAENQVTSYTYDAAGNKLSEEYPDHSSGTNPGDAGYGIVSFTLDPLGRVAIKQDQLGDTCTFNHDLAGRLTSRDYRTAANSPAGNIADSDTFTYDAASRMLTAVSGRYTNTVAFTYDSASRKATESLTIAGQTYTVETEYNAAGQLTDYTYPDGTPVTRGYSPRGELATIGYDGTTVDTRTYDDGGRMLTSSYNNGVSETRAYNHDNTLASISFSGAPIGDLSYTWDANKNKTSESITGVMSGHGFSIPTNGYDAEDRLVGYQRNDNNLNQSWNLSLVGDWNSVTTNAATQSRTHGPTHEILTAGSDSITHDAKGNITAKPSNLDPAFTSSLQWDFDNRLMSMDVNEDSTADATFKYDALGRRVQKNSTVYALTGQQVIAEYSAGTAASSPTEQYVFASYIDEPVLKDGTGGLVYYHRNQQYSILALTNSLGVVERYSYDAYGKLAVKDGSGTAIASSSVGNSITYTGRNFDSETGDYYYRARYYDPGLERFCSRDPFQYWGGSLSIYQFVQNSPLGLIDPLGTCPCAGNCFNVICDGKIDKNGAHLGIPSVFELTLEGDCPPESSDLQHQIVTTLDYVIGWSICGKMSSETTEKDVADFFHIAPPFNCSKECECKEKKAVHTKWWWDNKKFDALEFDFLWRHSVTKPGTIDLVSSTIDIPDDQGYSKCRAKLKGKIFMTAKLTLYQGKCVDKQ